MTIMARIRVYHAILASLAILAYLTGEFGLIHAWLGYGVAAIIVLRLLCALSGARQLGLMRFYPSFDGLNLERALTHPAISKSLLFGIALSLIGATVTGIAIDGGGALGIAKLEVAASAYAEEDESRGDGREEDDEFLEEAHESFANLMLLFVGMHVIYLTVFKRPLAKYMLFIGPVKFK